MLMVKAKSLANNVFVDGYYVCTSKTTFCPVFNGSKEEWEKMQRENENHYIFYDSICDWGLPNNHYQVEVDGDTVCMCSDMRDINNTYIYENDKVHCNFVDKDGLVKFNDGCFDIIFEDGKRDYLKVYVANHDVKIIGNIFD